MSFGVQNTDASRWDRHPTTPYIRSENPVYNPASGSLTISGVSGTVSDGNSITITGTGFGTKATAAPWLFDDFEGGTLGQRIVTGGWTEYNSGAGPEYSNALAYTGSQCARRISPGSSNDWRSAGRMGLNTEEFYYSGWFRWSASPGTFADNPQLKMLRVNSNPEGVFYQQSSSPSLYIAWQAAGPYMYGGFISSPDVGTLDQQYAQFQYINPNTWTRIEAYIKLSTPGVADGDVKMWFNGHLCYNHTNKITRTAAASGHVIDNFLLPGMTDSTVEQFTWYNDDVYVDTTIARVEISTSATWGNDMTRDVMVPTAWSDTSITCTVRGLTPMGGGQKYLYIITPDGTVNTDGYAL